MSLDAIIEEVRTLTLDEQKQLIQRVVEIIAEPHEQPVKKPRSLREFKGVGAYLYDGTDAQVYVNQLRSEWDDRP